MKKIDLKTKIELNQLKNPLEVVDFIFSDIGKINPEKIIQGVIKLVKMILHQKDSSPLIMIVSLNNKKSFKVSFYGYQLKGWVPNLSKIYTDYLRKVSPKIKGNMTYLLIKTSYDFKVEGVLKKVYLHDFKSIYYLFKFDQFKTIGHYLFYS
jgi:hypothetical protein